MNRRGKRLFEQLTDQRPPQRGTKQGRSGELIGCRNLQLLHRYYYHARLHRMRYDLVLEELVKEFSLSSTRIITILAQHSVELKGLFDAKPSTAQLTKLYPHFSWR